MHDSKAKFYCEALPEFNFIELFYYIVHAGYSTLELIGPDRVASGAMLHYWLLRGGLQA